MYYYKKLTGYKDRCFNYITNPKDYGTTILNLKKISKQTTHMIRTAIPYLQFKPWVLFLTIQIANDIQNVRAFELVLWYKVSFAQEFVPV